MTDISVTLYCYNPEKGLDYAAQALDLSKKAGYEKGLALSYYAAGVNYIYLGNFPLSIENLTKAKIILEKEDDKYTLGRCYMRMAGAHEFVMHFDTAFSYGYKAIQLLTQLNDSVGLPECYLTMGLIHFDNNAYDSAEKWQKKALVTSMRQRQDDIRGLTLADLGAIYSNQNNFIKSLAFSIEAMELLEKIDGGFQSLPIANIATIYLNSKDYDKSKFFLQKAIDIAEKQHDKYRKAGCLNLLGYICNEEKDYTCALKMFGEAFELFKQINNASEITYCYGYLGDTYRRMGDYASSFDHLFTALQMSEQLKDKSVQPYYLYEIGNIFLQLFKNKNAGLPIHPKIPRSKKALLLNAESYLTRAETMALEVGDIDDMILILKDISELKMALGDTSGALNAYIESVKYSDSVNTIARQTDFTRKELEYRYGKQQDSLKLVNDKKVELSKAELKLQRKATEEERHNKRLAGIAVLMLLLVSAFIYYLFFQRRKLSTQLATSLTALKDTQIQLINIEKEKEGEKVRQGISRDLHDNLGSTISGIAMYSHMMDNQLKSGNYENAKNSVGVIQRSANDIVGKLSDLVWSANAGQDSLQQLLERLHQYGLDMCSSKNIEFKMENTSSPATFNLPAEQRYYIYLVAKEAINNAVKYSHASLIELQVKETKELLEIMLKDNGKGFNVQEVKKGNGLDNMEKRMDDIGANYKLDSKPGKGTMVFIQLKITRWGIDE